MSKIPCNLVADLGAGSLRTAAIAFDGTLLAQTSAPTAATLSGAHHEGDPARWWEALRAGFAQLLRDGPALAVEAIAITGMTRSTVFLDAAGEPLVPAVLWRDRRSAAAAERLAAHVHEPNPALAINAFHPLARLAWLMADAPAVFDRLHTALEPKDFLNARLTGEMASDTVVAGRIAHLIAPPVPDALAAMAGVLPAAAHSPLAILGPVRPDAGLGPLTGVPVIVSSMDTWAATVGSGAVAPGRAYDESGTSEVAGLFSAHEAARDGLIALAWAPGLYHLGGPTQAGADALVFAHEMARADGSLAEAEARAAALPVRQDAPLLLPYLLGERAPLWRSDVSGMITGLTRTTRPDEVIRAAMEGVAHAVRDIIEAAEAATGLTADCVHLSGGGARSDGWAAIRAGVLGRPVMRPRTLECGLLGAAIAASVAIGRFASLADGARAMNPIASVTHPDPAHREMYRARAARYQHLKAFALALADDEA